MNVDLASGLLDGVRYISSPNCDDRPVQSDISLIVIHNISLPPQEFGGEGIHQLFTNTLCEDEHPFYQEISHLKVSSHLLIRRDGEIVQYVPFHKRAWHAGESSFQGRTTCNDFSIGIELEGTDECNFEAIQYKHLLAVIDALLTAYTGLSAKCITGHEHIAPLRKTDPGPYFDWQTLAMHYQTELPAQAFTG